ncbi:MAG TPA: hypothetical protein VGC13_29170 [Longimicrobium sp.]|uniref:hypothetical protein n=1 Tax=Longimicrobium sp. TaxID=2029185 RepID=UPI002EDAFD03
MLQHPVANLDLIYPSNFPELSLSVTIHFRTGRGKQPYDLWISYAVDVENWAGPWTIGAYASAVKEVAGQSGRSNLALEHNDFTTADTFEFICTPRSSSAPIGREISHFLTGTTEIIQKARAAVFQNVERDAFVTFFEFPPSVSTACEQYLLYFIQFLRDLGIEAGASIKHEAHKVLFSVTPQDGAEALDRIREALDIYLRLPDSPEFATQAAAYGDIAVQQLQANIFHLKGQLAVAGAVLQAKNAQIEALQLSNFAYQQLLATHQQASTLSLLPPGTSAADVEPLVPGVIEVTRYEGKGFTVNLPELLRRLKRGFSQE